MLIRSANLNIMMKAAQQVGRNLIRDFNEVEKLQISRKGPADFVSMADKRAEEAIYKALVKARPDYDFLMEEQGAIKAGKAPSDYCFIVDPLDGTSNFLHGLGYFCVSIALAFQGEIIAGCVYDPINDEHFWAEKDKGAYLGSVRLRAANRKKLSDALIGVGFGHAYHGTNAKPQHHPAQLIEALMHNTASWRDLGAAALELCYVAAGRMDGYMGFGMYDWDIAAASLIAKEAGASSIIPKGQAQHSQHHNPQKWTLGQADIICTNLELQDKLYQIIS